MLEADIMKQTEMKEKVRKEYLRRTRRRLKTSSAVEISSNTWVVLIRYSGSFLKWTRKELQQRDQRTRKPMHKALHSRVDIDKIYVSRKDGRKGLVNIEDNMDASIRPLDDYIKKSNERLFTATRNSSNSIMI